MLHELLGWIGVAYCVFAMALGTVVMLRYVFGWIVALAFLRAFGQGARHGH